MKTILFTPHVINTIKSLPADEQTAIANALVRELILERDTGTSLSPLQEMLYSIIRFYIQKDSLKFSQTQKPETFTSI